MLSGPKLGLTFLYTRTHIFHKIYTSLQWRHNERDGFSNHRRLYCLLNRLSRRRSRKTSNFRVIGLCEGNPPVTGGCPHKGSVTRKMFPFDGVVMHSCCALFFVVTEYFLNPWVSTVCAFHGYAYLSSTEALVWSKGMVKSIRKNDKFRHIIAQYSTMFHTQ